MNSKKLARKQLQEKFEELRAFAPKLHGINSWVRYLRKALGMSIPQLAKRVGISVSSLNQLERREAQGKASISSLQKAAQAMECEFVYAFVPRVEFEQILRQQCKKRAIQIIKESHLHMEMEDQAVSQKKLEEQIESLMQELEFSKSLWED